MSVKRFCWLLTGSFQSDVDEDSNLVGYYALLTGKQGHTFRKGATPSSSLPNRVNYLKPRLTPFFLNIEAVNHSETSVDVTVDTTKFAEGTYLYFGWFFETVMKLASCFEEDYKLDYS